jgi:RNA polymerase sigma-70 factor (ECF subfamily)
MTAEDPQSADRVRRAIDGDRGALEALWSEHRRWLASVLVARGAWRSELEDLLQDVAVTVVDRIGTLADPGALRPWLRRVATNTVLQAARRSSALRETSSGSGETSDPDARHGGAGLDDLADRRPDVQQAERGAGARDEVDAVIARALELPLELREPLLLRALGGMSQREIAEGLGLRETTVETRLARARRALRERERRLDEGRLAGTADASSHVGRRHSAEESCARERDAG